MKYKELRIIKEHWKNNDEEIITMYYPQYLGEFNFFSTRFTGKIYKKWVYFKETCMVLGHSWKETRSFTTEEDARKFLKRVTTEVPANEIIKYP